MQPSPAIYRAADYLMAGAVTARRLHEQRANTQTRKHANTWRRYKIALSSLLFLLILLLALA